MVIVLTQFWIASWTLAVGRKRSFQLRWDAQLYVNCSIHDRRRGQPWLEASGHLWKFTSAWSWCDAMDTIIAFLTGESPTLAGFWRGLCGRAQVWQVIPKSSHDRTRRQPLNSCHLALDKSPFKYGSSSCVITYSSFYQLRIRSHLWKFGSPSHCQLGRV